MKLDTDQDRSRPYSSRPSRMQSINTYGTTFLSMLNTLDSRRRMGFSTMFGMVFFLCLPNSMHLDSRILAGWISGIICFIGLVLLMMSYASPLKTRYLAQRQEAQHWVIFLLVVSTALTSIFAIALMLANNKDAPTSLKTIHIGLSAIAVLCSWFLTHIMFTLHYATCYYREDEFNQEADYAGGLAFPTEEMLDYFDFMYFSFTLGMTAQTSDVSITSRFMRRLVLGHGFVSFLFYSVIISLTMGVISGLV
ncbi:MAG: DUF1345 domain-containing protein [Cyanobacteria bacterium CAN_BIN43]|nr:DUF1345 domain-containing protein [Cyanobacteria bacterium CAN_BIN43]